MLPVVRNIQDAASGETESFTTLLSAPGLRLERIVSNGRASDAGFWYDQGDPEWVMLVRGTAVLRFDPGGDIHLAAGDFLTIPAHALHRVEEVSPDAIWLALHVARGGSAAGEAD